ncbi:nicotinate phosphoribosyltransferase [Aliiglaciecola sp. 3_MG-2023]|uniref:nicotinate phosphoribosyltransferase n=1 Tax=Aliiglaciecola sp. 3_MG-2023 TaxID=3062644 RepID=UPI0026E2D2AD|nr:nicotinate phosphoribosyltransferase [Aliiglaciecola sp. 3_MG-2023]MDO6693791.1 nicotinate phosphoribosyltransferase [Aliiglaciecola sp. 3_MG-2023]
MNFSKASVKRNSIFRKNLNFSTLDNDYYKMNMWQCFMHQYPYIEEAEYRFFMRSDVDLRPYKAEIQQELHKLDGLKFTDDQIRWLEKTPWYTKDFIEWARMWSFQSRFLYVTEVNDQLAISARGPLMHIHNFEMPVLSTVAEVYNRRNYPNKSYQDVRKPLFKKIDWLKTQHQKHDLTGLTLADFGTRRRFSYETQLTVVDMLNKQLPEFFLGTSNMHIAKELGVTPIGTMAHEIFMLSQQVGVQLAHSQKHTLECWVKEFRGQLGYALTDVIGMDAFVRDFDLYFAKLFEGLRQDSGCPFEFGEKAIKMYRDLKLDPTTKTVIFSDALNFEKMVELFLHFRGRIRTSFGIGTFLSNDVEGVEPLNMVMKLVKVNGKPVAKISDTAGKNLCDDENFVRYLKDVYNVTWA